MTALCPFTVTTYFDAIVRANQSDGCIDLKESRELFQIAHGCTVVHSGNDGIQNLYKQITGIANPMMSPGDPRPMTNGYFRIFSNNDHSKNPCFNFDGVQTQRKIICKPVVGKLADDLLVTMDPLPIHWCDTDVNGTPYHIDARNGALVSSDANNWRVLLQNGANTPLVATATALDMIRKNLPYPEVVELGIRLGAESTQDPWKVSQFGADALDILVAARNIDEAAKLVYANILSTYVTDRFRQLPDQVYGVTFTAQFGKSFYSFCANNLTKSQLGNEAKRNYYNDGVGLYHGMANDMTIIGGASYVIPFALKAGWLAVTGGLAAAGAAIAAAPTAIIVGAVVLVVGLVSATAVEVWSRFKGDDLHESQYSERVQRFVPREKTPDDN